MNDLVLYTSSEISIRIKMTDYYYMDVQYQMNAVMNVLVCMDHSVLAGPGSVVIVIVGQDVKNMIIIVHVMVIPIFGVSMYFGFIVFK